MKHLSLFDLDHTLLNVNISVEFGRYLFQRNTHSITKSILNLADYLLFRFGIYPLKKMHMKIFKRSFYGCHLECIEKEVEQFLTQHMSKFIYQPLYQKLKQAQEQSHYTAILSSSPSFLIQPIAKRFGVDEWLATTYHIGKHSEVTGIKKVVQGEDKALFTSLLLKRLAVTKDHLTVFSDSVLDLPFLELAETVFAVKPDKKLRSIAEKRKWNILEDENL